MLLKGVYLLPTPEQDRFTTFRFPTTISGLVAGLDFRERFLSWSKVPPRRRSTGAQPHYMLPLMRTRSRHDCSFVPGTPFLAGATMFAPSKLSLLEIFGFASNCVIFIQTRWKISFLMFLPSLVHCHQNFCPYFLQVDAVPHLVFGLKFA